MVFPFNTFSGDTFPSIVRDVGARFVADKSDSCSRSAIVEAATHSLLRQVQNDWSCCDLSVFSQHERAGITRTPKQRVWRGLFVGYLRTVASL